MQAHPQSIPAALIPLQSTLSPHPSSPARNTAVFHSLPAPGPGSPNPKSPAAPGIAQTSGLAHDAGNLLGALGLYCDLLRVPGVLKPEHHHYATELSLISSRSSELIRRLLALSPQDVLPRPAPPQMSPANAPGSDHAQISASHLQPSAVRRSSLQLLEGPRPGLTHTSVLRNLAPVLQRIGAGVAAISVVSPALLPPFDLPLEALERITVNLVRNAVEAIRKQQETRPVGTQRMHGEVRVALAVLTGRLQLTVEDNGPGLPGPVAAAFINPGPLPPNSTRGLGHRIVHDLVSSTGGQISIRTRPGRGTAFCLKWPLPPLQPIAAEILHASPLLLRGPVPPTAPGPTPAPSKGLASC